MADEDKAISVGRAVIIGTIASAIGIFLLVGLGIWAVTGNAGGSFALGAFSAAWGGPGFGVMVGGVMNALQVEHAAKEDLLKRVVPSTPAEPDRSKDKVA